MLPHLPHECTVELDVDELNSIEKTDFNYFRGSYSEMPKLVRTTIPNPNYPILPANTPAARFQKSTKHETTQYPVLKDVHYFDKFEVEFMTLAHTHNIHQVFDPGYVPLTQDEIELLAENRSLQCLCLCTVSRLMLEIPLFARITRIASPRMLEEDAR